MSANIDLAAEHLAECKRAEDAARAERVAAEEALIELIGAKEEGATTVKTDRFRVTTTGKLTRSLDDAALSAIFPTLPEGLRERVFPARFGLSLSELRGVEANDPTLYRRMAEVITVKPAKTAVSIEPLS